MARRKGGKRVLGPYEFRGGQQWQLIVVDAEGNRDPQYFETEKEALAVKRAMQREMGEPEKTVGEAIDAYEQYLLHEKGNKPSSVKMTILRLKSFFPDHDMLLTRIDRSRAASYYAAVTKRTKPDGKPLSADTHRNMLAEGKSLMKWCCVKRGWIRANPFELIEGIGRRRHGKPQLRIDEFRKFASEALKLAESGDDGALAALMTGLMGLRAQEITQRVVRDLDDDGHVLWIEKAKTEKGNRRVDVPEMIRPLLLALTKGKKPEDLIFATPKGKLHWRDWPRENVQRICRKVGVPEVCAHSMRGLHSTLAFAQGATGHVVAQALGHEDVRTTLQSYADRSVVESQKQKAVLKVIQGGRAA